MVAAGRSRGTGVSVRSFIARRRLRDLPSAAFNWLSYRKHRLVIAFWPNVDDLIRFFLMVFILKPAATMLPRRMALGVARWCGAIMLSVPTSGKSALSSMRRAFEMEDAEAKRAAREYLAQPFYSFVVFDRMFHGRESPDEWAIEEVNSHEVALLRESAQPFFIATGHFRRESFIALCTSRIVPGAAAMVAVPVPARSLNPSDIRLRVHYGQIVKAYKWARPDLKVLFVGDNSKKQSDNVLVFQLLGHLANSRHRVIMAVDAFWKTTGPSSHIRPFCGMKARPFSTGGATLSRLAQCPIVPCASYVRSNGNIVIEWGPVIAPPPRRDLGTDVRTTNVLVDFLENAIGRRPTQYVLHIGDERKFDATLGTWKDLDEKTQ